MTPAPPSLRAQRARLTLEYARLRLHHKPRKGVARKLAKATIRLLEFEVEAARRDMERARKAARADSQPSLLADLDRLI